MDEPDLTAKAAALVDGVRRRGGHVVIISHPIGMITVTHAGLAGWLLEDDRLVDAILQHLRDSGAPRFDTAADLYRAWDAGEFPPR